MIKKVHGLMLVMVLAGILAVSPAMAADKKENKQDIITVDKLMRKGEFDKALSLTLSVLEKEPDSMMWLKAKSYILSRMKRYKPALETAFHLDKLSGQKDIQSSMGIAFIYLEMKDKDNALKWLDKTMDRGYIHFEELQLDPAYKAVRHDPRFKTLIDKAKKNTGLGQPAKTFSAQTMDGKTVSLEKLKGKVVLIDFWATWCAPCVREIPHLKKLYDRYREKGFEIIGISMDYRSEKLHALIKKEQVNWPMIYSGKGKTDEICGLYNVTSAPFFWLIDRTGVVRHCGISAKPLEKKITYLLSTGM